MTTSKQAGNASTILSSKGQVIIPKSIRLSRRWEAGVIFEVIDMADGVLLKPLAPFAPTDLASVAGVLKDSVTPKSDQEIEAAKIEDVRRRWRDRN